MNAHQRRKARRAMFRLPYHWAYEVSALERDIDRVLADIVKVMGVSAVLLRARHGTGAPEADASLGK